ncbi:homeobox-leucine zipper protein ATHB-6-like [Punica granatum]|uniref:Homeobox-leucine zipper protein n=2 Tax=Punica granatum TaxID=22663 RepID=A0A218W059_PUNGR|nr:homeobox-leucine zipper protein ATHB-6-like [Punica granatum]OWM65651.1 hypothetical protein CDL15_Pgr017148 [Punica granatum]PKI66195.1 hypothetical protein CRG98_013363 [Punica granatum]
MKRLGSSDSLGALMSICRATEEQGSPRSSSAAVAAAAIYGREFQSMLEGLDEDGCGEEVAVVGGPSEKKRRLSVEQVKALEKNFEVENKLEPERKVKLAQELGLQPRQVAVWFQNRRARWKTKQLERDYGVLKANYDSLKLSYDALQRDNDALLKEIRELKSKLNENSDQSNLSLKDEATAASESENTKLMGETKPTPTLLPNLDPKEPNLSSDSDSSAILNEENAASSSPSNAAISSSGVGVLQPQQHNLMLYPQHYVKLEEHNFLGDEACNFFSDEQAPTLHWYCPDQWN